MVIEEFSIQLIALGSVIKFGAWVALQFRSFTILKQNLTWLLVLLSLLLLGISAVRISLNPAVVSGTMG